MPNRKIVFDDNLSYLKTVPDGSVDLIYIDPPFNTGKRQERRRMKVVRDEDGDRLGFYGKRYRTTKLGTSGWNDVFGDIPPNHCPKTHGARNLPHPAT